MNSEINDIRNTEKYISNDDYNKDGDVCSYDEDNHLSLKVDPRVAEIENIKEEVIDDESDNESIVSLINQSLTNSDDDSIDEEL